MIEIILGIVFEAVVVLFMFLFGVIQSNTFKTKEHVIQLIMSTIMFAAVLSLGIIGLIDRDFFVNNNSIVDLELLKAFLVLIGIIFIGSIYKYYDRKKNSNSIDVYILKKEDYKLKWDFDIPVENLMVARVQALAEWGENIIVFSGVKLTEEIDGRFVLREIKPRVYECLQYSSEENEIGIMTRISNMLSWALSITSMIAVALFVATLHVFSSNEVNEFLLYLMKPFALMSFGLAGFKTFQNVEGIFGIVFKLFGLFIAFVGFMYFFQ